MVFSLPPAEHLPKPYNSRDIQPELRDVRDHRATDGSDHETYNVRLECVGRPKAFRGEYRTQRPSGHPFRPFFPLCCPGSGSVANGETGHKVPIFARVLGVFVSF
jgi:hypothetical protein